MNSTRLPTVLTIAGSDSGAGAGIQADIKTFAKLKVFGTCAITAITAQNTLGVQKVFPLSKEIVESQIKSVMDDIKPAVWKTGMLANSEIVELVSKLAKFYKTEFLIVDPVISASSGDRLLKTAAINSLIKNLLPLTYTITPNINEAEKLSGIKIENEESLKNAALKIYSFGPKFIIIKGGHGSTKNTVTDVLFDGKNFTKFISKKVNTKNTHGTGCTFSAALASQIARGQNIMEAIKTTKKFIKLSLSEGRKLKIGNGHGPTVIF